ncbi:MAG: dethiobiotin synthase [Halobacteria archaeon]
MTPGRGLVIVGTDTGVGKTYVGCALLRALRSRGLRAAPYKPVETGCPRRAGRWFPRDASALLRASGAGAFRRKVPGGAEGDPAGLDLREVCPFPYRTPVAPALAARLERRPLSLGEMVAGHRRLARRFDFLLVETAGGLLSPLAPRATNRDLVRALGLPAMVVAANRLGALNHTLLTLEALERARVPVGAVVLNHPRLLRGPAERGNGRELRRLLGGTPVVEFSRRGTGEGLARLLLRR